MRRQKRAARNRKLVNVVWKPDWSKLFRACDGDRQRAMLAIFLYTGIRCAEVASLKLWELDLTPGRERLHVIGKGNKERWISLPRPALPHLRRWKDAQQRGDAPRGDQEPLFLSRINLRLSERQIRNDVAEIGQRAGLPFRLHPHLLRHSFGSQLYRETKDIYFVAEMLDHADVETARIYAHIDTEDARRRLNRALQ